MRKYAKLLGFLPVALAAPAAQAQEAKPRFTPTEAQARATPVLGAYTKDLLFGDVWKRPGLAPRDRSFVTVTALIAGGGVASRMRSHFNLALQNGVKPRELSALITQMAFYTGWPNGVGAAEVAAEIYEAQGIPVTQLQPPAALLPKPEAKTLTGDKRERLAAFAPGLLGYSDLQIDDQIQRYSDLSPRDRSLSMIVMAVVTGDQALLAAETGRALDSGLTRTELSEAITHLAFYAGWNKALPAADTIQLALAKRDASANLGASPAQAGTAAAKSLRVVRHGEQPRTGAPENFRGKVTVTAPFAADAPAQYRGATVTFDAGARTAWHSHARGQMLVIVSGKGYVQAEGNAVQAVGPGDTIWTPAGVKHWHGAARTGPMSHVAISDGEAKWGEHVAEPMP